MSRGGSAGTIQEEKQRLSNPAQPSPAWLSSARPKSCDCSQREIRTDRGDTMSNQQCLNLPPLLPSPFKATTDTSPSSRQMGVCTKWVSDGLSHGGCWHSPTLSLSLKNTHSRLSQMQASHRSALEARTVQLFAHNERSR